MKKRKKRSMPVMIIWDRRQQQRFVEAVERLVSIAGDLEVMLSAKKKRSAAAYKATATRAAATNGEQLGGGLVGVAGGEKGGVN